MSFLVAKVNKGMLPVKISHCSLDKHLDGLGEAKYFWVCCLRSISPLGLQIWYCKRLNGVPFTIPTINVIMSLIWKCPSVWANGKTPQYSQGRSFLWGQSSENQVCYQTYLRKCWSRWRNWLCDINSCLYLNKYVCMRICIF